MYNAHNVVHVAHIGVYDTHFVAYGVHIALHRVGVATVFMPTEAPSAIGQENILKSYEFIFTQIQLNIEFYIDEITVEGDFAFAVTSSKGTTLIHATGDTIPEANRELFVFEKVNGDWKIARYMFNKTEPKQ